MEKAMTPRRTYAASVVLAFVLAAALAAEQGCQLGGATTQPSAITATTDAEASVTAAAEAIDLGINLQIIPKDVYWRDIAPVLHAAQASLDAMRADLNAGKTVDAEVAGNAALAAAAQLQPWVQRVQGATKKK